MGSTGFVPRSPTTNEETRDGRRSACADALVGVAGEAPDAPALWDRTQRRITKRRRRRAGIGAVAVIGVLTIGAGAGVAITSGDDVNRLVAGSGASPDAPDEILGLENGRLAILSAKDGSVVGRVPSSSGGDDRLDFLSDVTAVVGSSSIITVRVAVSSDPCGMQALHRESVDTSESVPLVVNAASPLLSPDGETVAYTTGACVNAGNVGIADTSTGASVINEPYEGVFPLAWTPDSKSLLVVGFITEPSEDPPRYWLVTPNDDGRRPLELPTGVHAATFLSDDELLVAYSDESISTARDDPPLLEDLEDSRTTLATVALATGETRIVHSFEGRARSISFDPASGAALIVAVNPQASPALLIFDGGKVTAGPRLEGLEAAVWFVPEGTGG